MAVSVLISQVFLISIDSILLTVVVDLVKGFLPVSVRKHLIPPFKKVWVLGGLVPAYDRDCPRRQPDVAGKFLVTPRSSTVMKAGHDTPPPQHYMSRDCPVKTGISQPTGSPNPQQSLMNDFYVSARTCGWAWPTDRV
jgi:hypothetical protein